MDLCGGIILFPLGKEGPVFPVLKEIRKETSKHLFLVLLPRRSLIDTQIIWFSWDPSLIQACSALPLLGVESSDTFAILVWNKKNTDFYSFCKMLLVEAFDCGAKAELF